MSIANPNLEQARRPLVTRLLQNRLRVERWLSIKDAELGTRTDITGQLFGGYGLLDGTTSADLNKAAATNYPKEAFANCSLIEEKSEEGTTPDGKKSFHLYQVYETLTDTWALEDADKPAASVNGLRTFSRAEVARPGTLARYDQHDVGVATSDYLLPDAVVVEGAGTVNIDEVYVRDGDANSKPKYQRNGDTKVLLWDTVYWRISTASGTSTFYRSTEDVATPNLVSTWSEVGGGLPVPTVRRATWADVDDAGLDASTIPTRVGGTLYLAGFEDDSDDRRGRFLTRWMEAGTLNRTEDFVGSQRAIVLQAVGEVPSTPSGYSLARTAVGDFEGFRTNDYTFLRPCILTRTEDFIGSQRAIVLQTFGEVPTTPAGYSLAKTAVSDFEGIETRNYSFLKPSILSDTTDFSNNEKLQTRTVEAFNEVVATPSNFVRIREGASDVEGVPTRRYVFAKGAGIVADVKRLRNNGKLENRSITELSAPTVAVLPTGLSGYVLVDSNKREAAGHTVWQSEWAKGEGEIQRQTRNGPAGLKYLSTTYLTAPTATEPAQTFDIFTVGLAEASGHRVWSFSGIDDTAYTGAALIDNITAERDGALVVVRSAWNADPPTPTPGTYYQVSKKTKLEEGGKKTVLSSWVKPPASYTEKRTTNFKKPGVASVVAGRLELQPGPTQAYVATISHTFTLSPAPDPVLYNISWWSTFQVNFKSAETDQRYFKNQELPGYLGSSTWSGTGATWAGVPTSVGSASISSVPTAAPTGQQNIDFSSVPYLSSISGVKVYRNTTTSINLLL